MPPKVDKSAPTDILIHVLIHITPITFRTLNLVEASPATTFLV